MESIFERLAQALQGNAELLAELQRLRSACEAGVNQADDVLGFVKRLRFAEVLDAAIAGSIQIDLLFEAPLDAMQEEAKQPTSQQNARLGVERPMDKEGMLWLLDQTIKDLQHQETTEYRSRYFGECLALNKTLAMIGWLDTSETDSLYLQIVKAHEQALRQCLDAGEIVSPDVLRKEAFRRQQAEKRHAAAFIASQATGSKE